ncbi:hypothetical protein MAM1_0042d02989 [Mucor ambiguus]|uniref:F-box domain-containing protein n=1 Tax=Mucor ambiguus TaxID=91626 RepID=A0A0C9M8N9_9FUNG|nr:hypothetical protein MAM1_0042d02989 [Mucor ambiguus]
MASLPPEILSKVFQDLDRNDELECTVVCQAWCSTALRHNRNYLLVNWKYCQSITQLQLELVRNNFEDIPHVVDIYSWAYQFPALRTLVLELHTIVCLHSLLCSCPQLESLQLCYGCRVNHLNIYEDEDE